MPLTRRRSFVLGQAAAERPGNGTRVSTGSTTAPRGMLMDSASLDSTSCLGARVSRRALGISSIFFQGLRTNSTALMPRHVEKGQLLGSDGFNNCLLEYRDKVHTLEQLNQQLEEQIHKCLDRKTSSAKTWLTLKQEWEDIYRQVTEAVLDNARLVLQTDNIQAKVDDLKQRVEHEQLFCKAMEEEISSLYKVIDNANFSKVDLETNLNSRNAELLDLTKTHEEDVRRLCNQLMKVDELEPPTETSLDQILSFIHSHWKKVIGFHLEGEKVDSADKMLSHEEKVLENLTTECNDAYAQIQSLQAETESIKALKRGLGHSINDAKHWHGIELQNLGAIIGKLESELADVREDIELQQHDYETLLDNKKTLERAIEMYHGILDGEEKPTRSLCGSAVGDGRTQHSPEQPSSTDNKGSEVK